MPEHPGRQVRAHGGPAQRPDLGSAGRVNQARVVADADAADVLKMVGAIAWAAQGTPDSSAQADRLLALLMNGLRHGSVRR